MASDLLAKLKRATKKSPRYLVRRFTLEARASAERFLGPPRARRLTAQRLARAAGTGSVDAWWAQLAALPYLGNGSFDIARLDVLCPGAPQHVLELAEKACAHQVVLLGSGPVSLGEAIDWSRDIKTGRRWEPRFHRDIEYTNLGEPSDVKLPWELSRLQWALPLGQAWKLTADERYALAARQLLDSWIADNPYGASVNWACTMEPALRILSWTWLFHALNDSVAWREASFRARFLQMLYLHADFVARNLEGSDINGNHYTADAAGLVYAGLFFGDTPVARRWLQLGWQILEAELPRQVHADGVDFEASVPYHRLVLELFAYPALYRLHRGLPVGTSYREQLLQMGRFVAAYSRNDGSTPLWGDADDGRALAFGTQDLNDHRYLLGVLGVGLQNNAMLDAFSGPRDEVVWLLGMPAASQLPCREAAAPRESASFPRGGFYVLRHREHHVFIDCGPLCLAGRGGHGHNDLLSFELALYGIKLVSDCGAHVYTASVEERNAFRSTAYHSTPKIDGEEINRFVRPDYLWSLHNDARHLPRRFEVSATHSVFEGSHDGYGRLTQPVTVVRRFELNHVTGALNVTDQFVGRGEHHVIVPFHLAPGVTVAEPQPGGLELKVGERRFALRHTEDSGWTYRVLAGRISPSYGVTIPTQVVHFERRGALRELRVVFELIP